MAERALIQFCTDRALKQSDYETTIKREEAKNAFHKLREQAADVPQMTLDEINTEISAIRTGRKR